MKRNFFQTGIWIVLLVISVFIVLGPILREGFLVTDDGNWMIIRLSAFYQSLRDGQFPVRFLGRLNYSYGYPVANFLYPGFMYIGSLLHIVGLSFQASVETIIIGFTVFGVVSIFLWLKTYFSAFGSFLGGLAYLVNPYMLYDIYTRGSVGEIVAINTFFGVLWAFESGNHVLFIPLFAFLLISHNTTALFCFLILAFLIFVRKKYSFIRSTLIALGCSLFFWIPAIVEKRFVLFDSVDISNPLHYFPASHELLIKSAPIGLLCIGIFFLREKKYLSERVFFMWLTLIGAFFVSELSVIFWGLRPLQLFVQFPYRLFILWLVSGSWLISYCADSYKKIGITIAVLSIIWLGYGSIHYVNAESIIRADGYFSTNEGTTTVANEYMPRWITTLPTRRADKRLEIVSGNAQVEPISLNTNTIHAKLDVSEDSVIQINTLFYPGWGAMLDDKPVTISYNNVYGLMQIPIQTGEHTLYMSFRETKSRFIADMLSVLAIIFYFLLYVIPQCILYSKKKNILLA